MRLKVTNIQWSTTILDERDLIQPLPTSLVLDLTTEDDLSGLSYDVIDALKEETGFTPIYFNYTFQN